jgi:hypothetical protein
MRPSALINIQLQLGVTPESEKGETVSTVFPRVESGVRFGNSRKTVETVEDKTSRIATQLKLGVNEKTPANFNRSDTIGAIGA